MKIIIVQKSNFISCPPIISVLLILRDLGWPVELITISLTNEWRDILERKDVKYFEIADSSIKGRIGQIISYLNFRRSVKSILEEKSQKGEKFVLWVEGAHTILALGKILCKFNSVMHILELHENNNYQLHAISRVINNASAVVMPEYNRAVFYQIWFKLSRRPFVLPNKPYFMLSSDDIERYNDKYRDKLKVFKSKKVILYQGHIGLERDMTPYLNAIKKMGDEFQFVVLGKDHGAVTKYRNILPSLIHIDFIPAPEYLIFTKNAYIGIVSYVPSDLNNAYCAPNKIWECTNYGLPILANDIPGLKYTIEYSGAGVCVDENNEADIIRGIKAIDENYNRYSMNSIKFCQSADNKLLIKNIVEGLAK